LQRDEAPLEYNDEAKRFFNMTVEVKTKVIDNVTRTLHTTYTNYTVVRKCNIEDFSKVNQ